MHGLCKAAEGELVMGRRSQSYLPIRLTRDTTVDKLQELEGEGFMAENGIRIRGCGELIAKTR
jgi:hypothetical protein